MRQDDPLVELTDRMLRLRHAAWTLNTHPDYSVVTLHDLAGLGMQVHLHTAAAHGIDLAHAATGSPQVRAAFTYQDLAGQLHHSDDPDRVQQKLDGARTLIATPQRLKATPATYDKLVATVPASQPYRPPVVRAGAYDHPALLRKSEFA